MLHKTERLELLFLSPQLSLKVGLEPERDQTAQKWEATAGPGDGDPYCMKEGHPFHFGRLAERHDPIARTTPEVMMLATLWSL